MIQNTARTFARGGEDWEVAIWNPYPQIVVSDGMAYSRGQCAFDTAGAVVATGDFAEQVRLAVKFGMRSFSELDMKAEHLTRAVVYYDAKLGFSEPEIQDLFYSCLDTDQRPSLVLVPLPAFPEQGMVQEIDLYGSTEKIVRKAAASGNAVQAGDTIYLSAVSAPRTAGDAKRRVAEALKSLKSQVSDALASFGAELDDVVKIMTYATPELLNSPETWQDLVEERAGWFKERYPVITDVPLRGMDNSNSDLRVDVIAKAKTREDRVYKAINLDGIGKLPFASPHPAGVLVGKHFYVGGRLGLTPEGEVLEKDVPEYQTRMLMNDLGKLLDAVDMTYENVIKKTTYFIGNRGVNQDIRRNFSIRAAYYRLPGPASTGIAVDALPLKGAMLVSEATAIRD